MTSNKTFHNYNCVFESHCRLLHMACNHNDGKFELVLEIIQSCTQIRVKLANLQNAPENLKPAWIGPHMQCYASSACSAFLGAPSLMTKERTDSPSAMRSLSRELTMLSTSAVACALLDALAISITASTAFFHSE